MLRAVDKRRGEIDEPGGLTGMGVGATCIVRFELALLSPASALFAAASLGVAAFIHLQWDPEVQRQELETKLKKTLSDEVGQTWKKEEAHLEKELAKTALRVTQMYVAQRARVEVKQVGTGRQGLMDALEYQRLLSKNKALLQEELQRRMRDELRRADSLQKDPKQQQEARKVMGPPPRFITRDGGPAAALLVNPHRVMTHDGRSAVVSEVRARHAYETSVFRPTECHVAKFLLEEWLHEALLKMENSARSSNPAPSNEPPTNAQLQAQAAQDRAWDHLFGAGCGR